jgi:fused signal recognition particle receptor
MVFNWFRRKFDEEATPAEGVAEVTPTDEAASETGADTSADTSTAETETEDKADVDATSATASPSSDVYLEWAKAAFQNIQQRQTTEATTVTDETLKTSETNINAGADVAADLAADLDAGLDAEIDVEADVDAGEAEPSSASTDETLKTSETNAAAVADAGADVDANAETTADAGADVAADVDANAEIDVEADVDAGEAKPSSASEAEDASTPIETPTAVPTPSAETIATPAEVAPEPAPEPEPEKPSTPAWMRAAAEREARLERLQETAITASDAFEQLPDRGGVSGEIELDEDFIWSAEVLAAQGRSADDISVEEIEWLTKLRSGLGKTRIGLVNQLKSIVGQGPLNEDAITEIEALLLQADVGVDATDAIIEALQAKMREETLPPDEAIAYLKQVLRDMLEQPFERNYDRDFSPVPDLLNIWMMTGVNGAGKTTTIGKLTHLAKSSGYDCLIAAADTFRAAAVEQVKVWGERTQTDVIANPGQNTDPASVVFDAIEAAKARNVNLLLIDTAGRLQNKKNLMDELSKMRRIINTKAPNARIESLLVLDATLGQNGLRQAEVFAEAAQLSGVVLTKLDGSARGGVALAVVRQLGLPIRFIGAGEGIEDLRPFSSYEFVEALLDG